MGATKHITSACTSCRRRKIKCDGDEPCSNCTTSQLDCHYNVQSDLRRISAKKVIQNLQQRLTQLESILKEHTIDYPSSTLHSCETDFSGDPANSAASEKEAKQSQGGSQDNTTIRSPESLEPIAVSTSKGKRSTASSCSNNGIIQADEVCNRLALPHEQLVIGQIYGTIHPSPTPNTQTQKATAPGSHLATEIDSYERDSDRESDITDLLASRMGSLRVAEDGQLRYYGPTSNLHLQLNGSDSLYSTIFRQVNTEGDKVLHCLGLDQQVPESVETHLAKIYFAWENPVIYIVDEAVFFEEKALSRLGNQTSPYYSETLNNAICAVGACLAQDENFDIPEPAAEFFSSRAKALLDIEMDSPTVATVQAVAILSASEASFMRDARGWIYSGMAARLSQDLGLHLDLTSHLRNGILNHRDLKIRQTTFWGVFIHDNMWSLYVGRPGGISIANSTIARPINEEDESSGTTWNPYPALQREPQLSSDGISFPVRACTAANISLCELMRTINSELYSGCVAEPGRFYAKTKKALSDWHESLPSTLQIDLLNPKKIYLPAVLQLHMQFLATLLALYRPYHASRIFHQEQDQIITELDIELMKDANTGCVDAANKISTILRLYKRQYSLRRVNIQLVHVIFTAAIVFIHDICTRSYIESRSSLNNLQFCCHALGEIGQSFNNANRALEIIILVKSQWQRFAALRRGRSTLKRPSVSISSSSQFTMSEGDSIRSKRHHSSSDSFNLGPPIPWAVPIFGIYAQSSDNGQFSYVPVAEGSQTQTSVASKMFQNPLHSSVSDSVGSVEWTSQPPFDNIGVFDNIQDYEAVSDIVCLDSTEHGASLSQQNGSEGSI